MVRFSNSYQSAIYSWLLRFKIQRSRYRPSSPGKLPLARSPPRTGGRAPPRPPEAATPRPPLGPPRIGGPPARPRATTPRPRPAYTKHTKSINTNKNKIRNIKRKLTCILLIFIKKLYISKHCNLISLADNKMQLVLLQGHAYLVFYV